MYFLIRPPEESPRKILNDLRLLEQQGKLTEVYNEEELYEIAQMIEQWANAQGRFLFEPNEKEISLIMCPKMILGISGGNRSGKTATCAVNVVMQIEGWHPLQRENLVRLADEAYSKKIKNIAKLVLDEKKWISGPPVAARIVCVDYPNYVNKIVGPEIEKWSTKEMVESFNYANDKKRNIIWKNGSFAEFMTYEQDLKAHGGAERDIVMFDEEPPQAYFDENLMRVMSSGGRMLLGMTAVKGITWTEDRIWTPGERGHRDIFVIEMSSYDNPVNTKDDINRIKKLCHDKTEIDIRIKGKRVSRGGRVFKEFQNAPPHVIQDFTVPSNQGFLMMSIDPHPKLPHGVLFAWVDTKGGVKCPNFVSYPVEKDSFNVYFVYELFQNGTIPQISESIKLAEMTSEALKGRKHEICIADPAAWINDQTRDASKSVAQLLEEEGIYPVKGSKNLMGSAAKQGGLFRMMDLISVNPTTNLPRFFVTKNCERFIWEMMRFRWPAHKGKFNEDKKVIERPIDKDDHLIECARRITEYILESDISILERDSGYGLFSGRDTEEYFNSKGERIQVSFWGEQDLDFGVQDNILGE